MLEIGVTLGRFKEPYMFEYRGLLYSNIGIPHMFKTLCTDLFKPQLRSVLKKKELK